MIDPGLMYFYETFIWGYWHWELKIIFIDIYDTFINPIFFIKCAVLRTLP